MDWVLLVDDEEEIRGRMAAVLEKEGMKVTQLANGEELLAYIEGMVPLPDLVLLDVVMGGHERPGDPEKAPGDRGGELHQRSGGFYPKARGPRHPHPPGAAHHRERSASPTGSSTRPTVSPTRNFRRLKSTRRKPGSSPWRMRTMP